MTKINLFSLTKFQF